MVLDRSWVDPSFALARTDLDTSYTYDGYLIVSGRFRSVVGEGNGNFQELPSSPGFFSLTAINELKFDTVRRKTVFDQPCSECGRYFVVAGAIPVFLAEITSIPDVISRTDVEFGTGDEQHPLILTGPGLATRLRRGRLAGVELRAIGN
jgi:hypothetical protein